MRRERRRAAIAAVLLLAVTGLTGCNKIKSKQEIKRGNEFLKAAQYQSALAAYEAAGVGHARAQGTLVEPANR